jgi:hypothetical protein
MEGENINPESTTTESAVMTQSEKMAAGRRAAKLRKEAAARKRLERRAATKPLPIIPEKIDNTSKGQAAASWRPARITDMPTEMKDSRYVYRFVIDTPNSLRKRLMEQWEIDMDIAKKMDSRFGARTLQAGLTVVGAYRINELILVRMPVAVAESRKKYFEDKSPVRNPKDIKGIMAANAKESGADGRSGIYTKHPSGVIPDMNKSGVWDGQV